MDEHPETVHRQGSRGAGRPEQGGVQWVHDDVGHDLAVVEQRRVERERTGTRSHADRRGVDHEVGGGDVGGGAHPTHRVGETGGDLGRTGRAVHDGHVDGAGAGQRQGQAPAGAARPEQHHPPAAGIGARLAERSEEAVAIGVVTLEAATRAPDHGVDGLEARCRRRAEVDGGGHVGLVRHGHAQALDPEGPHAVEGVGTMAARAMSNAR